MHKVKKEMPSLLEITIFKPIRKEIIKRGNQFKTKKLINRYRIAKKEDKRTKYRKIAPILKTNKSILKR